MGHAIHYKPQVQLGLSVSRPLWLNPRLNHKRGVVARSRTCAVHSSCYFLCARKDFWLSLLIFYHTTSGMAASSRTRQVSSSNPVSSVSTHGRGNRFYASLPGGHPGRTSPELVVQQSASTLDKLLTKIEEQNSNLIYVTQQCDQIMSLSDTIVK